MSRPSDSCWTAPNRLGWRRSGPSPSATSTPAPQEATSCSSHSTGDGPKLLLQAVTEPKTAKNRVHFDIETPHVETEVDASKALGARRLEPDGRTEHGTHWVVMADSEGNEFCVCDGGTSVG